MRLFNFSHSPIVNDDIRMGESRNWFKFLKVLGRNHVFRSLFWSMILVGLYSGGLTYLYLHHIAEQLMVGITLHSLLGATLSLMLVFRTNTSNERWWEGRKLVGGIVNCSRNLALKLNSILPAHIQEPRQNMAALISSYTIALKEHLREGVQLQQLTDLRPGVIHQLQQVRHVPNRLAQLMNDEMQNLLRQGDITPEQMLVLDRQLELFTDLSGGCERIKRSPLPFAYSLHLKVFILVYVLTLPFALINTLGWYAVPATMGVFYAMVGLELIGEEIEDPFGTDESDIPMDTIAHAIRHNVYEILAPAELKKQA